MSRLDSKIAADQQMFQSDYVDDSSDSEDEEKSESCTLIEKWQSFSENELGRLSKVFKDYNITEAHWKTAFCLHYWGISIFNRQNIRKIYQKGLRPQLASTPVTWPSQRELQNWITNAIVATIDSIFLLTETDGIFKQKDIRALHVKFTTQVKALAVELAKKKDKLLRCLNNEKRFQQLCQRKVTNLFTAIHAHVNTLVISHQPKKEISSAKLSKLAGFKDHIFLGIKNELIEYAKEFSTLANLKQDLEDLPEDKELLPHYQRLYDIIKDLPEENSDNEEDEKSELTLQSDVNEVIGDLMDKEYLSRFSAELVSDTKAVGESTTSVLWQFAYCSDHPENEKQAIRKFLKIGKTRYESLIKIPLKNIHMTLLTRLNTTKPFAVERSTLRRRYKHSIKNTSELFASVRLSNRSQLRMIRNIRDTKEDNNGESSTAIWQFAEIAVQETQAISINLTRSDVVEPKHSYPSLAEKIKEIELSDKEVAQNVRQLVTTGNLSNQINNLAHRKLLAILAYMLFGTEVARNPASIIMHQILLDLIIGGYADITFGKERNGKVRKLTWQLALDDKTLAFGGGGRMPMSLDEKAVASSRYLQHLFNPYMPHRYFYPGDSVSESPAGFKSVAELLRRQHNLCSFWFKMKMAPQASASDEIILLAVAGWYPAC